MGHRRQLLASLTMLTLTPVRTLIHADGPVEFEARDAAGRRYLAGLVEYRDDGDVFIVVPAREKEIAAVAAGAADARRMFLANGESEWYLSEPCDGTGRFAAHRQHAPISEYENDGDPGFSFAGESVSASSLRVPLGIASLSPSE